MDPITLYFIFQADMIQGFIMGLTLFTGTVFVSITFVGWLTSHDSDGGMTEGGRRIRNATFIAFLPLALLAMIVPTTGTLVKTWGVYATLKVAQDNEQLGKLPDNLLTYFNTYLENEIENLQDRNRE